MKIDEVYEIAAAVITAFGGSVLVLGACSSWLAGIWASRMLQNERAKHDESLQNMRAKNEAALEDLKAQIDTLKQKDLNRHFDKLTTFRDVVHIVSEILEALESITSGRQEAMCPELLRTFSKNRHKAYGYISLVSSQEVMDRYNELIEFFIPVIYEGKQGSWTEMRTKADKMLNAMRKDLGILESDIVYRGTR